MQAAGQSVEMGGGERENATDNDDRHTQLRLENDHPGAMAGKDHTVAEKQSGGRGEGGVNNSRAKRMGGKGREKALSPFQPAGHGKHTRRAEKPRDPAMLGQGGRGVEDFSPSIFAQMPNLWAAWACGNPDRIRTTRLLSWFRTTNEKRAL